jgi:hypothetical protein
MLLEKMTKVVKTKFLDCFKIGSDNNSLINASTQNLAKIREMKNLDYPNLHQNVIIILVQISEIINSFTNSAKDIEKIFSKPLSSICASTESGPISFAEIYKEEIYSLFHQNKFLQVNYIKI